MTNFEKIRQTLGEPYYGSDGVLLYNLDCCDGLRQLGRAGLTVDTTITSPPYNIGKEYETVLSTDDYVGWLREVSSLIFSVTKEAGAYLLNIGYLEVKGLGRAVPISYLIWDKTPFYLQQEIIWNYGAGVASKRYLSPRNEKILWYVKDPQAYTFNLDAIRDKNVKYPNQKKKGKLRCNTLGKNPSDVWEIAKVTSGENRKSEERTNHPAQYPIDLVFRLTEGFTNPNEIILDPFMGSGTTAEACVKKNRLCLGFEINKEYCEIAANRIETATRIAAQEVMFEL